MTSALNIIRRSLLSEKNSERTIPDQPAKRFMYSFEVDIRANKKELRTAFIEAFGLKPEGILGLRTLIRHGKPKRRGRMKMGWRPDRKVAYLTLNTEIPDLQHG
ncbi:MAG: 50S ribosomal protein L23 [Deltaproteobacteria bacterium]|jgi:ribosomal protein L23|nr:50S ribosomal protein L23 [Deltaproteobacteria bacterium]